MLATLGRGIGVLIETNVVVLDFTREIFNKEEELHLSSSGEKQEFISSHY